MCRALSACILAAVAAAPAGCVSPLPGTELTGNPGAGNRAGGPAGGGGNAGIGGVSAVVDAGDAVGSGQGGAGGTGASPFVFVSGVGKIQALAVDSNNLYWVNPDRNALTTMPTSGAGMPTALARLNSASTSLAARAGSVYWSDVDAAAPPRTSYIFRMQIDGVTPIASTMLVAEPARVRDLAANQDAVYWVTSEGSLMKVGLDGGTPTQLATTSNYQGGLTADDQNLYWLSFPNTTDCNNNPCESLWRLGLSGGAPTELARVPIVPGMLGIGLDSMYAYLVNGSRGGLVRVDLNGGPQEPVFAFSSGSASFAVDASGVYWTDTTGTVFGALPGAAMPRVIGSGYPSAFGVALDATSVYWITPGPSTAIMRAPK